MTAPAKQSPYAIVYIDHAPSQQKLLECLNGQWEKGWEYVTHLSGPGPKQALLMKRLDAVAPPPPWKVIAAIVNLYNINHLTTTELLAGLTQLLSNHPDQLPAVRVALGEGEARRHFEGWLRALKDKPVIAMSNGVPVLISDELLEVIKEEQSP
jgi:hypothetical protein